MSAENPDRFEYDVALSFVGEDKATAQQLTNLLTAKNIKVFHDEHQAAELLEEGVVLHIAELYRVRARYCIMLISQHYPLKKWTDVERTSAREHALRDPDEYILPIRLDDTEVPGITEASGYRDLREHSREHSMESIVDWLAGKLAETRDRSSGPPSRSHDLRSGNVPHQRHDP